MTLLSHGSGAYHNNASVDPKAFYLPTLQEIQVLLCFETNTVARNLLLRMDCISFVERGNLDENLYPSSLCFKETCRHCYLDTDAVSPSLFFLTTHGGGILGMWLVVWWRWLVECYYVTSLHLFCLACIVMVFVSAHVLNNLSHDGLNSLLTFPIAKNVQIVCLVVV